jgi:hypothetical protein
VITHYVEHSPTGDWIRECAAEAEETARLPVIPQDFSIADEVLRMSREEILDALASEFGEAA